MSNLSQRNDGTCEQERVYLLASASCSSFRGGNYSNNVPESVQDDRESETGGDVDVDVDVDVDGSREGSGAGVLNTFVNSFKSNIGVGILSMPYAFAEGGLVQAGLLITLMSAVTIGSVMMLIKAKEKVFPSSLLSCPAFSSSSSSPSPSGSPETYPSHSTTKFKKLPSSSSRIPVSYGTLVYATLGIWGSRLIKGALTAAMFGSCIAYLAFMGDNLFEIMPLGLDNPRLGRAMWILVVLLAVIPLSQLRKIEFLAPTSAIGVVSVLVACAIIFYFSLTVSHDDVVDDSPNSSSSSPSSFTPWSSSFETPSSSPYLPLIHPIQSTLTISGSTSDSNPSAREHAGLDVPLVSLPSTNNTLYHSPPLVSFSFLPVLFGLAAFANEGIVGLCLPIHSAMSPGLRKNYYLAIAAASVGIIIIVNLTVGIAGAIGFGTDVCSEVTLSLPDGPLRSTTIILLCVQLLFTYPQVLFVVTQNTIEESFPSLRATGPRLIYRTLLVLLSAIVAISIPSFGLFLALVGAFANSIIMFVIPPLVYVSAFRITSWKERTPYLSVVLLGTVACIVGTTSAILNLIHADSSAC